MQPINYTATNPKLAKTIDDFNARLTSHLETAAAIAEPMSVEDDEALKVTTATLFTSREAFVSEELTWHQNEVRLACKWIEILKAREAELEVKSGSADKSSKAIHSRTGKALTKNGLGVEAQPAFKANDRVAAERQFEHLIRASAEVQEADNEAKHQRRQLAHAVQQRINAEAELVTARASLRVFVQDFLEGKNNGQTIDRQTTITDQPHFSQQRVSAR